MYVLYTHSMCNISNNILFCMCNVIHVLILILVCSRSISSFLIYVFEDRHEMKWDKIIIRIYKYMIMTIIETISTISYVR